MSIEAIQQEVTALSTAWEDFKKQNDARVTQLEKKGVADPITTEQVKKLSDFMDTAKGRMDAIETAAARTFKGDNDDAQEKQEIKDHRKAFCDYVRKGNDANLAEMEKKALSVTSDPDGGYLVTPEMSQTVIKKVFETSPLRQVASVQTIGSDALEIIEDKDEASAGWTSETAARTSTNTPQIGKKIITAQEMYAKPEATQKLLDDANINIEQWLSDKLADKFSRLENTAFISGNGVGQPRGILTYASGTSWGQIEQVGSGSNGVVSADNLISLYYTLKTDYAKNSTWVMNRLIEKAIRLLKESTTNQYIWQPGLQAGQPNVLLGQPVMQASDMPVAATASLSIALADFKRAYQIVDRVGIRILRDPYSNKPYVQFYTTKRTGGDVANYEAIKLLRLS